MLGFVPQPNLLSLYLFCFAHTMNALSNAHRRLIAILLLCASPVFGQDVDVNSPGFWKKNTELCINRQSQDQKNAGVPRETLDRKSTRLNSSHHSISYA